MPPPREPLQLNTYHSLLTAFTDFLIVAIHTILYERGLYPPETFLLTRAYNFPVRQNRHPLVCKWIQDAVSAVHDQMLKGTVRRVVLVIYSDQQEVLERFLFDVERFPAVPEKEAYTEFENESSADGEVKLSKVDVEEQLRATVRMLAYCGGKLGELPEDCTYTLAVELKDSADPPIGVCCSPVKYGIRLMGFSIRNRGYHPYLHYRRGRRGIANALVVIWVASKVSP
jgi:mitotic spindle assembly checkpoint protein MAD2B